LKIFFFHNLKGFSHRTVFGNVVEGVSEGTSLRGAFLLSIFTPMKKMMTPAEMAEAKKGMKDAETKKDVKSESTMGPKGKPMLAKATMTRGAGGKAKAC
jgi:hypothetical protein